jgi:hypothetical protein
MKEASTLILVNHSSDLSQLWTAGEQLKPWEDHSSMGKMTMTH